jgi:hypothetical protein
MKISKQLKNSGKATFEGPQVKDRKKFAPPTKVEKSKKTYNRTKNSLEEDEQYGEVPLKPDRFDKKSDKFQPRKSAKDVDEQYGEVPLKPDRFDKKSDKFQPRKSAKDVGKNPTRKTAKQIRGEEDEEKSCWKGYEKRGMKKKGGKKVPNCVAVNESKLIKDFIDNIIMKNYAQADKYLREVVELKVAQRLAKEVNTPLFDK